MIADLTSTIEETTARNKDLTTQIASLEEEISENKASLDQATALRAKENGEWNQNEKDAISAIGNLKGAVTTLAKHNEGAAMLQRDALVQVTHMLRRQMKKQPNFIKDTVAPHQRRLVMNLLQEPEGMVSLVQQSAGSRSHAPGGGEIF